MSVQVRSVVKSEEINNTTGLQKPRNTRYLVAIFVDNFGHQIKLSANKLKLLARITKNIGKYKIFLGF